MSEGAREEQQAVGGEGPKSRRVAEWRGAARGHEVHEAIEGARKEMRAAIGDLKSIRYRLLGVHGSIPPSPQETSKGDLEGDPDVETEIRTVIANGVRNSLDPFIDDLETAVEYQPGPVADGEV